MKNGAGVIDETEDGAVMAERDARDYDVDHYSRLLRETFAIRMERAFAPGDFEAVFEDPEQMSLFSEAVDKVRTVLTIEDATMQS